MRAAGTSTRWLLLLPLLACAGIAMVVLYRVDPSQSSRYPKCAFHWLTGLHCPGCGATRAVHALLHGRVLEALRFNALLIVGVPCLGLFAWWQHRHGIGVAKIIWMAWALALVIVVFGVARNIPRYPFELLAPPPIQSGGPSPG
jgi:hypothetical protein